MRRYVLQINQVKENFWIKRRVVQRLKVLEDVSDSDDEGEWRQSQEVGLKIYPLEKISDGN